MSGPDDLRTARFSFRNAIAGCLDPILGGEPHEFEHTAIDAFRALLADPDHRLAILDEMGLDIREGTLIDFKPVSYDPDPGWVVEPPGDIPEQKGHHAGVSVFVVCPRGAAPDALFTCPKCGMTSANPSDVKWSYCGNCNEYTRTKGTNAPIVD